MTWEERLEHNALKCDIPYCRHNWTHITPDTLQCLCDRHYAEWVVENPQEQAKLEMFLE